jgi:hypothetical protein
MKQFDLLDGIFRNYTDAEAALVKEHFVKQYDVLPTQFKYNWEYGLVDAGIKAVEGGYKIIQRA